MIQIILQYKPKKCAKIAAAVFYYMTVAYWVARACQCSKSQVNEDIYVLFMRTPNKVEIQAVQWCYLKRKLTHHRISSVVIVFSTDINEQNSEI